MSKTTPPPSPEPAAAPAGRILVALKQLEVTGGYLRFERAGQILQARGYQVCFATVHTPDTEAWHGRLPVITLDQAREQTWDVTMVPGIAGFACPDTLAALEGLRDPRFGLRIQHLLNDQSRRDAFLAVNYRFLPHLLVFNNPAWPPGSYTQFQANEFHTLIGGVDYPRYAALERPAPAPGTGVIGAQAHKNAAPLIDALERLPPGFRLRLIGEPGDLARDHGALVACGRLELCGVLDEAGLLGFHRSLDYVVSPETRAGWSNLGAEALAAGTPLICTGHGTQAYAVHRETAWVLNRPSPEEMAEAVLSLDADEPLRRRMAAAGRERIRAFAWPRYCDGLEALFRRGRRPQYYHLPAAGLYGKWPVQVRLAGLAPALERCAGATVLDLGAAEGVLARAFLDRGARLVHGFEADSGRVEAATALCDGLPGTTFRRADLNDWRGLEREFRDLLLERYDIVLYLGLHHHLDPDHRRGVARWAADRARRLLVLRTPPEVFRADGLQGICADSGLHLAAHRGGDDLSGSGGAWTFERSAES